MQDYPKNQEDREPAQVLATGTVVNQIATEAATNRRTPPDPFVKSQKVARKHTTEAFDALVEVMQDKKAAATARVTAANTILEWGHGKRGETPPETKIAEKVVRMGWRNP